MADLSHIGGVPDGAYVADGTGDGNIKSLQSMTETSVRASLRAGVDDAFGFAKDSFFGKIIDGIGLALQGITQGGLFAGVDRASLYLTDGQENLNGEVSLLSPILDYGSACMPAGQPMSGPGFMPFSRQIGPMRNVEIYEGISNNAIGLRLLDKGLWDIQLHATASWVSQLSGLVEIQLNVYPPGGGDPYSTQRSIIDTQRWTGIGNHTSEQTQPIATSVVIPEAGYYVLAKVERAAATRAFLGGPAWSRLTAQHISRAVEGSWSTGAENSDPIE